MNQLKEIFVDNFAGGGGTSTGIELAFGVPVTIAVNHDPIAIAMHKANHPNTEHFCESVWDIDPVKVCKGRPVGLAWFSPDCKHFSKAKGGKPVDKNIRGLAWVAVKWAATVHPRVIILENVEEFKTWGPLKGGYPDITQKGRTFNSFVNALKTHGYEVEWKELKACDYGAPTIRKRFFLIARNDGQPIIWPKPTHGNPNSASVKSGKLKPWRTAAEIIDWTIPCPSIFERNKPLADKTVKRIARGLDKFVLNCDKPFIIQVNHDGEAFRGQNTDEPFQTVTAKNGFGVVTPVMTAIGQNGFSDDRSYSVKEPVRTVVTKNEQCLVTPVVAHYKFNNSPESAVQPLSTVTGVNSHYLLAPSLVQYHSETAQNEVRGQSLSEPIMTVDGSNRYALTAAFISKYYKSGENTVHPDSPLPTVTTKDRMALIESHLCVLRKNMDCYPHTDPLNTVTTSPGHFAEIRTYLTKVNEYNNLKHWPRVRELLNTYCGYQIADDEILIIEIGGIGYFISDIGMRMLEPKELFAAQGFPDDYIINFDTATKKAEAIKKSGQLTLTDIGLSDEIWEEKSAYTKAAQTARAGNSVPPPFAKALVSANLPEYAVDGISTMAELKNRIAI